ncbi:hypothetical protein B0H10DRAFT_1938441 [Mycena sp. CBHHK59/15]|nr:hypothetical protein B0H10DRAFT_1938441 [Mycena sp. CBHHK59/15]
MENHSVYLQILAYLLQFLGLAAAVIFGIWSVKAYDAAVQANGVVICSIRSKSNHAIQRSLQNWNSIPDHLRWDPNRERVFLDQSASLLFVTKVLPYPFIDSFVTSDTLIDTLQTSDTFIERTQIPDTYTLTTVGSNQADYTTVQYIDHVSGDFRDRYGYIRPVYPPTKIARHTDEHEPQPTRQNGRHRSGSALGSDTVRTRVIATPAAVAQCAHVHALAHTHARSHRTYHTHQQRLVQNAPQPVALRGSLEVYPTGDQAWADIRSALMPPIPASPAAWLRFPCTWRPDEESAGMELGCGGRGGGRDGGHVDGGGRAYVDPGVDLHGEDG